MSLVLVMSLHFMADQMPQLMLSVDEGLLRRVSHLGLLPLCHSIANAALHEVSHQGPRAKVGRSCCTWQKYDALSSYFLVSSKVLHEVCNYAVIC